MNGVYAGKKRIEILNFMCYLIKNKHKFGLYEIFGEKGINILNNKIKFYISISMFISLTHIFQLFYVMISDQALSLYHIYRSCVSFVCFISQLIIIFQFITELIIQKSLFQSVFKTAASCISDRLSQANEENSFAGSTKFYYKSQSM